MTSAILLHLEKNKENQTPKHHHESYTKCQLLVPAGITNLFSSNEITVE